MEYIKTKDEFYENLKKFTDVDDFITIQNIFEDENLEKINSLFLRTFTDIEYDLFLMIPKKLSKEKDNIYVYLNFKDKDKLKILHQLQENIGYIDKSNPNVMLTREQLTNLSVYDYLISSINCTENKIAIQN